MTETSPGGQRFWIFTGPAMGKVWNPVRQDESVDSTSSTFWRGRLGSRGMNHEECLLAGEERTLSRTLSVIIRPRWQTGHSRKERPVSLSYRSR
jgi:hypothetical protein